MNEIDKEQGRALDAMFTAARRADPVPSTDLMARILADADAVQAQNASAPINRTRSGFGIALADMFGGWAGVSTLAACACLGIWVGLVSPDIVLSYMPGAQVADIDEAFGLFFEDEL